MRPCFAPRPNANTPRDGRVANPSATRALPLHAAHRRDPAPLPVHSRARLSDWARHQRADAPPAPWPSRKRMRAWCHRRRPRLRTRKAAAVEAPDRRPSATGRCARARLLGTTNPRRTRPPTLTGWCGREARRSAGAHRPSERGPAPEAMERTACGGGRGTPLGFSKKIHPATLDTPKKRCSVPRPSAHQSGTQCSCVDNFRKLSRSPEPAGPPRPASPKVVPPSPSDRTRLGSATLDPSKTRLRTPWAAVRNGARVLGRAHES